MVCLLVCLLSVDGLFGFGLYFSSDAIGFDYSVSLLFVGGNSLYFVKISNCKFIKKKRNQIVAAQGILYNMADLLWVTMIRTEIHML